MKELNNFLFYASFLECVENAPESERAETVYAIVHYGIYGKIPDNVPQSFKMIFPAIKPNIDSSIKRYNAYVENGKKGGRPKKEKPNQNQNETKLKPNNNQTKTKEKPNQNLDKEKEKEKDKEIDIDKEYQQQKEINKEKDFDVVDDVDNEKKQFAYSCCSEKLNKFFFVLETETYSRIEKLFSDIYDKDSFIISNEKINSSDVLLKLVQLFSGNEEDVINRFNELFVSIDNAENVNNKFKYSVSVLYQYACNNC